jgi:hypothetical protein
MHPQSCTRRSTHNVEQLRVVVNMLQFAIPTIVGQGRGYANAMLLQQQFCGHAILEHQCSQPKQWTLNLHAAAAAAGGAAAADHDYINILHQYYHACQGFQHTVPTTKEQETTADIAIRPGKQGVLLPTPLKAGCPPLLSAKQEHQRITFDL